MQLLHTREKEISWLQPKNLHRLEFEARVDPYMYTLKTIWMLSLSNTHARTHTRARTLSLSLFSSLIVYLIVLPFSPESEKPCGLKMERGERGGQHKKCIIGKTD